MGKPKHTRQDKNQREIVESLEANGVQVFQMHEVGGGFPDLLTVFHKEVVLIEVKRSVKDQVKQSQIEFLGSYRGYCGIAWTEGIAHALVGLPEHHALTQHQKNLMAFLARDMRIQDEATLSVKRLLARCEVWA